MVILYCLMELEADRLIIRKEYPQIPPKVEYSLSDRGKSLMKVLDHYVFGAKTIENSIFIFDEILPVSECKPS